MHVRAIAAALPVAQDSSDNLIVLFVVLIIIHILGDHDNYFKCLLILNGNAKVVDVIY